MTVVNESADMPEGHDLNAALDIRIARLSTLLAELSIVKADKVETRRSWRWIKRGYVIVAFDILLSVAALIFGLELNSSVHAQCSLYGLLIPSYREASRLTSPLGPHGYDAAFIEMQRASDSIHCGIAHSVPKAHGGDK